MRCIAFRKTLQSVLCLCLTPPMVAQQPAEPQSARYRSLPTAMIPDEVVIPKGTRIELVSMENVSSDTVKENSLVRFALAKDLVVNEVTVLDAGTPVEGRVSRVRRGVPYRQWGELTITIREIQIGNHAHMRLTSSDPEPGESKIDEWAQCALVFPLCITAIIAFSTLGPTKPAGNNEPCCRRVSAGRSGLGLPSDLPNSTEPNQKLRSPQAPRQPAPISRRIKRCEECE